MIVGISIALVFVLIIIGVPIAFALGSAGILLALYAGIPVISLAQNIFASVDVFAYLALPMFFLAGTFMEYGGISRRLIKFSNALVGHFYGGLGMICALAGMFVGSNNSAQSAYDYFVNTDWSIGSRIVCCWNSARYYDRNCVDVSILCIRKSGWNSKREEDYIKRGYGCF